MSDLNCRAYLITIAISKDALHGGLFFFIGERIQCPISCITRSKGGRRASRTLSTKGGREVAALRSSLARSAGTISSFCFLNPFHTISGSGLYSPLWL